MRNQAQSLEITAGMMVEAINRKGGKPITVSVGNYDTAFTDGNRIAIPSFPEEKRFIGLAYLGHEASHCRITDMDKFSAFARKGPVYQSVLNIVEDIRIERSITRIYPGLIGQLKRLVEHMVEQDLFKKPTQQDHPLEIFIGWLLYSRRARVLGQSALDGHDKSADRLVRKVFGDAFIDTMEADLACLKTMDITPQGMDESVAVAQRILDRLKQKAQDEQQQPQQGQQGNGGEQSDGDGGASQDSSQAQSGDSGEQSSQSQSGGGDPQQGQSSDGRGGGPTLPNGWEEHQAKQKVDLGDLAETLANKERAYDDSFDEPARPLRRLTTHEEKEIKTYSSVINALEKSGGAQGQQSAAIYRDQLQRVDRTSKSLAGPVRREMRALLEGQDRVRFDPRRSGRLNRRSLSGVMTGESRVFHRKVEGKAQRAAVHILLDASGSMKREMPEALVAVHSILEALEPLARINTGFSVFPANVVEFDKTGGLKGRIALTSAVKSHGESLASAKRRRDYFPFPRGGTPMVSSMMGVVPVLLSQPEERKILIVVTDGSPDEGISIARMKCEEYRSMGVEIIGIGIDAEVVKYSFGHEHSLSVKKVTELPKALKKVVRSAIS